MDKLKAWLSAARLRTLPLSLSGILVGTGLAAFYGYNDQLVFILAMITTVGLQITSNFANDYGDGVKGTDNAERQGPVRMYQAGRLSRKELKSGIFVSVVVNIFLIGFLLNAAFGTEDLKYLLVYILLGIASIWAAIKYTVGSDAYGYRGLGDVFVFLFFGLLSVLGSMFLFTKFLTVESLLPACSMGLLSTAVLNINNMRDMRSDSKSGKSTVVVKLGFRKAKRYHAILLFLAFISMALFIWINYSGWPQTLCLIPFIPLAIHLRKVWRASDGTTLDPELKKVALSTFSCALLFYFVFKIFL